MPVRVAAVVEASGAGRGGGPILLNASGYVTARRRATVSSKMTGKVVEVLVEEGMAVKAGQVLARLDDTTLRRYLELAEAELGASRRTAAETEVRLKEARQTLERARALVKDGISGQADLDKAEAEVDALSARLELTREQVTVAERQVAVRRTDLDDTVIRAPFAGIAHLEGRAARRDGVAGVGRRRVHAHRASRPSSTCRRSRSRSTSTRASSTA